MRLEHTPALAFALRRALRFALAEGLTALEPTHLLRGLLAEDEGHCAAILRQAGFDLAGWHQQFALPGDAAPPADSEEPDLRVTAAVRHILNQAREHMSAMTDDAFGRGKLQ